ncbi:TLD domain-containing protein 1-like [Chenopodium quinoa]|uniref:TLD domain-containing protein 1-like n=1 Tax=Chenopodium quinoa TaxID=63459 RepID=UPI000B779230|nr:TLD domain-containing protein 1-like [Chenopodium quinoa]
MGNSQSSSTNPRFVSASRSFTQHKLDELQSLFNSLATESQSNGKFISPSVFKDYFKIPDSLGDRMFDLITQKRHDQKLTFEDLVIAKATYEKGTKDDIEEFIYQLLDVSDDGKVDRSDLQAVLAAILYDLFPLKDDDSETKSHQCIIDAILNAAIFSKDDEVGDTKSMSFEDFKDLCGHIPSLRKYLGSLLSPPDPGRVGSQVPRLLYPDTYDSNLILKEQYAWLIGGLLTQLELVEWKLLYHSSYHGQSFNTFLGKVAVDEGPTVLIIKDTEGCVYGGYASQPWQKHSDFYGDLKCFLFQLHPKLSIYRPTGANNNLQWCAVNYSSESIPNGIGFGGRAHHFGLFLTANFDAGQTFECTTFGSPPLSKSNRICPEVIECWSVFPREVQLKGSNALEGTVLERFKEDRNMLNLVGLANSSQ